MKINNRSYVNLVNLVNTNDNEYINTLMSITVTICK